MVCIQLSGTETHVTDCYGFGHVELNWTNNEHRDLLYIREPFNNQDDVNKWRQQGYTQEHFTGEMYDMRNPQPLWFDFLYMQRCFPWAYLGWSFYKMTTCTILPEHSDTYKRFFELFPQYHPDAIRRAVVFLEDWQPGHVLTIGNEQMKQWKRGDFVWWQGGVIHSAANVGLADRYTLQLTGYNNENMQF